VTWPRPNDSGAYFRPAGACLAMVSHRLAGTLVAVVMVLLAGCTAPVPDGPKAGTAGRSLHLYVSNQSFDQPTADLLVTVDGEPLFDGEADVEGQHNWMLREADLAPGEHVVEALERATGTRASQTFDLPEGEERWVVVDYWNPLGDEGDPPGFTISVHDEQVAFD
jgi:hypothetical protein